MSVSTNLKTTLINRINDLSSVQAVYGYPKLDPQGWPAVWVMTANLDGEFASTTENSRVYGYDVWVLFPQNKKFSGSSGDPTEFAENRIAEVTDDIIDDIAKNFTLPDPSVTLPVTRYVNAANAEWGVFDYEGGKVSGVRITLLIYTEFNVNT